MDFLEEGEYVTRRESMVTNQIMQRGITEKRLLDAMRTVPRHLFVPAGYKRYAYSDHPLPIGEGQTISQPYMVALMTNLLEPQRRRKGARDRHRFGLPGSDPRPPGSRSTHG